MSTPYAHTPRVPAVPHSTPLSAAVVRSETSRRLARAPILNPYDKFSQTDFDSWIGGITGALRHALGQAEVEEAGSPSGPASQNHDVDSEQEESFVEDSFAEIKLRREVTKGKARDPREGPGLGEGWNKEAPIEILSDSEGDGSPEPMGRGGNTYEEEAEEGEGEDEEQDSRLFGDDEEWDDEGSPEVEDSSMQPEPRRGRYGYSVDGVQIAEMGDEGDEYEEEEDYHSSDGEQSPPAQQFRRQSPTEVIDLESDEEDQLRQGSGDDDIEEGFALRSSPGPVYGEGRQPTVEDDDLDEGGFEDEHYQEHGMAEDNDEEQEDDVVPVPIEGTHLGAPHPGGDDDELQPLEVDTSFPPRRKELPDEWAQQPDIPDPWSGPRTYAEDYYSGGDAPLLRQQGTDSHRLEGEVISPSFVAGKDEHMDDESPFLPEHPVEDLPLSVELPNVWEGPATYAEDYYAGGDFDTASGDVLNPNVFGTETKGMDAHEAHADTIVVPGHETPNTDLDHTFEAPTAVFEILEDELPTDERPSIQVIAESAIAEGSPADVRPLEQEAAQSVIEGELPADDPPPEQEVAESVPQDDLSIIETEVAQGPAEPELFIVDSENERPTLMEFENLPNLPLFVEDTESIFGPDADFDLEYPEMPQGAPLVAESVVVEIASTHDIAALDASMELLDSSEGESDISPELMDSTDEATQLPPPEPPVPESVLKAADIIPEANDETEESSGGAEAAIERPAGVQGSERVAADVGHSQGEHDRPSPVQSVPFALDTFKSVQDHDEAGTGQNNLTPIEETVDKVSDNNPRSPLWKEAEFTAGQPSPPIELPERSSGHHRVGSEETPDENVDRKAVVAEAADKGLGFEDAMEVEIAEQSMQYSVDEATSEEGNDDEDAYGEEDNDEVEVLSVSSSADLHLLMHIEGVEELAGLEEVGGDLEIGLETEPLMNTTSGPNAGGEGAADLQYGSAPPNSVEAAPEEVNSGEAEEAQSVLASHSVELSVQDELTDIASPVMDQANSPESRFDVPAGEAAPVETNSDNLLQAPQPVEQIEDVSTDVMLDAVSLDNDPVEVVVSVSAEAKQMVVEEVDKLEGDPASKYDTFPQAREPERPRESGFAYVEMVQRPAEQQTLIPYPASLSVPESPSSIPPPKITTPTESHPLSTNEEGHSLTRREEVIVSDSRLDSKRVAANLQPLFISDPYPARLSNPISHEQHPLIHQTSWSNAPSSELAFGEKTTDGASTSGSPPLLSGMNSKAEDLSTAANGVVTGPVASSVFSLHLPTSSVQRDPFESTTNAVTRKRPHASETPAQSSLKDGVVERSSQAFIEMESPLLAGPILDKNSTTSTSKEGIPFSSQNATSPARKPKRGTSSPKKRPRSGSGSGHKKSQSAKGKDKFRDTDYDTPADGQVVLVKPRKRSKLHHSTLPAFEGTQKPTSQSGSVGSNSSALSAARLLQIEAPTSSRASSVVSSAASEQSDQTQPSPTTQLNGPWARSNGSKLKQPVTVGQKIGAPPSQPHHQPPSVSARSTHDFAPKKTEDDLHKVEVPAIHPVQFHPSLFHAHGKKRNVLLQHRTMPIQIPPPSPIQSFMQSPLPVASVETEKHHSHPSSDSRQNEQTAVPPLTPTTSHPMHHPQSPSSQAPPQTPDFPPSESNTPSISRRAHSMKAIPTNSPVTRSHCRFHTISIPKDEGGSRIFFIVPGCSLTKFSIIEDEEIEDQGDVTLEDMSRRVEDIESLGFQPYLVAVLRSLVGADIMREGEIFYLPLAGETVVRHRPIKAKHSVASSSRGPTASTSVFARETRTDGHSLHDVSESESDEHSNPSDSDYEETKPVQKKSKPKRKLKQPQSQLQPEHQVVPPKAPCRRGGWSLGPQFGIKRPRPSFKMPPFPSPAIPSPGLTEPVNDDERERKRAKVDDTTLLAPESFT